MPDKNQFVQDFLEDYSDESFLAELRRVASLAPTGALTWRVFKEHGRVHPATIIRRFGSLDAALCHAGLESRRFHSDSQKTARVDQVKKSMIAELARVAQTLGRTPSKVKFDAYSDRHKSKSILHHFGSWSSAIESAGLPECRQRKQPFSKTETLENLKAIHVATGVLPSYKSLNRAPSRMGKRVYERVWGSFSNAIIAYASSQGISVSNRLNTLSMCDDDLIQELNRVHEIVGKPPTQKDVRMHSSAHPETFRKRLGNGSWLAALSACGIPPSRGSRRFADEDLFANIASVWTELGRRPKYDEIKLSGSQIAAETYVSRYGSWRKALILFLAWANGPDSPSLSPAGECRQNTEVQIELQPIHDSTLHLDIDQVDRDPCRVPSPRLRFRVLRRDSFRCVLCGRSPEKVTGLILHVDHMIAWTKGGRTEYDNLRTLCEPCNLGKGDLDP